MAVDELDGTALDTLREGIIAIARDAAKAILEVNGYAGKKSLPSAETTGSATS